MSIQGNINSIIGNIGTAAYLIKDLKFKREVSDKLNDPERDIPKIQKVIDDVSAESEDMYRKNPDQFIDKKGLKRARRSMSKSFKGREEAEVSLGTRQEEIQYMKDLEESRAKGEIGF